MHRLEQSGVIRTVIAEIKCLENIPPLNVKIIENIVQVEKYVREIIK